MPDTGLGPRQLAEGLPEALEANGMLSPPKAQLMEMSQMLVGTVQSVTDLTTIIASMLIGSERSGFGAESPQELLNYMRFSRGFRG